MESLATWRMTRYAHSVQTSALLAKMNWHAQDVKETLHWLSSMQAGAIRIVLLVSVPSISSARPAMHLLSRILLSPRIHPLSARSLLLDWLQPYRRAAATISVTMMCSGFWFLLQASSSLMMIRTKPIVQHSTKTTSRTSTFANL
jgi:hypothetical protein